MIDRGRALRPLEDAAPAISRLETYESPAELAEALRATWHAVDTSLRALLRSNTDVPDDVRMMAMSRADLPHDALVAELRRRDLISLRLAGRVHELMQGAARAESGAVRPADGDAAADTVRMLRDEIDSAGTRSSDNATTAHGAAAASVHDPRAQGAQGAADDALPGDDVATEGRGLRQLARGPVLLASVSVIVVIVAIAMVFLFGRANDMDRGVEAFRAGNMGVAEQQFRAALARDDDNVTARLYLGRILRAQGRQQEAADVLRMAATRAPRDAAVRRELGYLFLDLDRAPQAADQFRQAVELDPEEPMGWVALYEAMVRADDPRAAELLQRAPASAQAMIRSRMQ
jgi:tetratricopeptide (TPR) repeat protein